MTNPRSFIKRLLLTGVLALGVAVTIGGSIAGADAPPRSPGSPSLCGQSGCTAPPISAVEVKAAGTYALLSFTTIEPTIVTIDHKPATTMAGAASRQATAQVLDGKFQAVST